VFPDFDPSLLDNPEFKEDSVREVIITPILSRLGYTPSGSDRVVRSKALVHPFIYAGTRQVPITLIPDYTLLSEEKPVCVLDAKRPSEDILSRKHIQQAYSYAIHPEMKCADFALCNGRQLAVFSVDGCSIL
jgi:predicted type IV restriction endonuclease